MIDILVTNDDGFDSAGFYPLLRELSKKYRVRAVVPFVQQSWVGKSLSAHRSLTIAKRRLSEFEIYTVDGTPADCVQIGLYELLDAKPRMVVSGINTGPNTGHGRILSSGTIGAAMEAAIDGVAAVSSSVAFTAEQYRATDFSDKRNYQLFDQAARITARIVDLALGHELDTTEQIGRQHRRFILDDIDVLSLNIPYGATTDTEIQVTVPHRAAYGQLFAAPTGEDYAQGEAHQRFSVSHRDPALVYENLVDGTDLKALSDGKVSLTPLNLDLVARSALRQLSKLLQT